MLRVVSDRPAEAPPLIRLDGVGKTYADGVDGGNEHDDGGAYAPGPRVALRELTLAVRRGDILGIAGTDGAGKSTLLRMVNGLDMPDRGSVVVDGQDLGRLSRRALRSARQQIGTVFAQPNLLTNLTVFDNVALPLRLHGALNAPRLEKRVRECLDGVGLGDRAADYPARLSPGQRQRVAIARALAGQPAILLCDEPGANLDQEARRMLVALLAGCNATLGTTILVASRDLPLLGALCKRVAVLEDGAVAEQLELGPIGGGPRSGPAAAPRTAIGRELACYGVELQAMLRRGELHA